MTYPNGTTTNYGYDVGSRLTSLVHQGPGASTIESLVYAYDASGNRMSYNRGTQVAATLPRAVQVSYDAANEQIQFDATSPNLVYDPNGNLTSQSDASATTTYIWDARNRLTAISGPNVTASFEYDVLGRRISKTINEVTTEYQYDGDDMVAEIGGGSITATYLRGLNIDEPFVRQGPSLEYYHVDALGSVLKLTNSEGNLTTSYLYEAFGKTTILGASANPFQYTGRENDGTGLYYYRNRYYSDILQRFITEDPLHSALQKKPGLKCQDNYSPNISWYLELDDPGSAWLMMFRFYGSTTSLSVNPEQLHLYTYVYNSPVNKIDPTGLYAAPQTAGCDPGNWGFNRCATKCCNEHDDCYARAYFSWCDQSTWIEQFFPYGKYGNRTRVECQECNSTVMKCIARATWHWGSRRKDSC